MSDESGIEVWEFCGGPRVTPFRRVFEWCADRGADELYVEVFRWADDDGSFPALLRERLAPFALPAARRLVPSFAGWDDRPAVTSWAFVPETVEALRGLGLDRVLDRSSSAARSDEPKPDRRREFRGVPFFALYRDGAPMFGVPHEEYPELHVTLPPDEAAFLLDAVGGRWSRRTAQVERFEETPGE